MKAWFINTLTGLRPASRTDEEIKQASKLKLNEYYQIDITKPRNSAFHRKFFALLNLAFENQELISDIAQFRSYVTMRAGFYDRIVTDKGEFFLPKSISFSKMDQVEFNDLYEKVFSFILELLDCNNEELKEALSEF